MLYRRIFSPVCVCVKVWKALLKEMCISTLLAHLGKMTADKLLMAGSPEAACVCERIRDEEALLKAREIHTHIHQNNKIQSLYTLRMEQASTPWTKKRTERKSYRNKNNVQKKDFNKSTKKT